MSLYNETTHAILAQLRKKPSTALQLAYAFQAKPTTISTILLRLYKQGCVERERIQDGTVLLHPDRGTQRPRLLYLYHLSQKGKGRLNVLDNRKRK